MGRLLEVTQFVVQDYDLFKAGSTFDNPLKQSALAKLTEEEKNPKSELNTACGGIGNVRRIRVLRDSDVKESDTKFLTLLYDLKTPAREIARKKSDEDFEKARAKSKKVPLYIDDLRGYILGIFKTAIEESAKYHADLKPALQAIFESLEGSALDKKSIMEMRLATTKLFAFTDGPESEKRALFDMLDRAQALFCLLADPPAFRLQTVAPPPRQNRPPNHKKGGGKPQNRPQGQSKPQPPPQAPPTA
jgi:hypothetical protein